MGKRKYVISIAVMFLIPLGSAQTIYGFTEDFEDEALGEDTFTGVGYTYSRINGANPSAIDFEVIGTGLDSTSQSLRIHQTSSTNTAGNIGRFTLDTPGQVETIQFYVKCNTFDDKGTGFTIRGTGGDIFEWDIFRNGSGGCFIIDSSDPDCAFTTISTGGTAENKIDFTLNWGTSQTTLDVNDGATATRTVNFCDSPTDVLSLDFLGTGFAGTTEVQYDQVVVDGGRLSTSLPPQSVQAEVVKLGSVTTSGRVELQWTLSPNDPNQDVGTFDYLIYVNGTLHDTDTVDSEDGDGVRKYTYLFTGSSSFGPRVFSLRADDGSPSAESCTVTVDLDDLGDFDSCGVGILTQPTPSEFSGGIDATVESWGFVTAESKMLFIMALVGGSTVGLGAMTKWVAPGRWKNYALLGVGVMLALLGVFITYLETWVFLISFILAVFVVRGGQAARNTYLEVRDAVADLREHGRTAVETKADLTPPPGDFMGATDTQDANDAPEDFEEEIVDEVPEEIVDEVQEEIEIDFSEDDRE